MSSSEVRVGQVRRCPDCGDGHRVEKIGPDNLGNEHAWIEQRDDCEIIGLYTKDMVRWPLVEPAQPQRPAYAAGRWLRHPSGSPLVLLREDLGNGKWRCDVMNGAKGLELTENYLQDTGYAPGSAPPQPEPERRVEVGQCRWWPAQEIAYRIEAKTESGWRVRYYFKRDGWTGRTVQLSPVAVQSHRIVDDPSKAEPVPVLARTPDGREVMTTIGYIDEAGNPVDAEHAALFQVFREAAPDPTLGEAITASWRETMTACPRCNASGCVVRGDGRVDCAQCSERTRRAERVAAAPIQAGSWLCPERRELTFWAERSVDNRGHRSSGPTEQHAIAALLEAEREDLP